MTERTGEVWRFQVHCPGAERVYLVREAEDGSTAWLPMRAGKRDGEWVLQHPMPSGRFRFRYFRGEGATILNCGSYGLIGERLGDPESAVAVDRVDELVLT